MSCASKPPNQEVEGYHKKHLISPCDMIFRWLKRLQGTSLRPTLTLNLLTTTIVAPPSNDSKWQMGFNSVFKGLILSFIALFYRSFRKYPLAEMIYRTVVYLMQTTLNASLNSIAAYSKTALRLLGEVRSVNFLFCLSFLAFCCELPDARLLPSGQVSQ